MPATIAKSPKASAKASSPARASEVKWFANRLGLQPQAAIAEPALVRDGSAWILIAVMGVFGCLAIGAIGLIFWFARPQPGQPAAGSATPQLASTPVAPLTPEQTALTDGQVAQVASAANQPDPASPPTNADPASAPNGFYAGQKTLAEDQLKAQLPEPDGVQYRDVRTMVSGGGAINFCGQVNSRNPMGAYIGFQRFISSASSAQIEEMMTPGEFSQAWRDRCGGDAGPQVWG